MMTNKEFDDKQQKYFDDMNSVGLGELILFSKSIVPFVEKESQRNKVLKVVTGICGYQTNAREFAKKISYEDFKNTRGITEATAIGMKLFLLYQCGVDWLRPNVKVVVFGNVGESEQEGEIPPKLPQISQNIEPGNGELEKELKMFLNSDEYINTLNVSGFLLIARHFVNWQKEQDKQRLAEMKEQLMNKTLEFFYDQLNDGDMECGDIEKFIENYRNRIGM